LQRVLIKALEREAKPEKAKELVGKHKQVYDALMDREKPAEHFKPPNTLRSKAEVLEYINTAHRKLMSVAEAKRQFDVHIYTHPSKSIGDLNGVQWFYYIAYHKMRHMKQIETVMAHPDFPGQVKKTD
jgi:hypothetical protein